MTLFFFFSCEAGNVQGLWVEKGSKWGWMKADICERRCESMVSLNISMHESVLSLTNVTKERD